MSNESNLKNCSEDIFEYSSESNGIKLRRSQRILDRSLKTPTYSERILEEFSSQCYSQFLLSPSQADFKSKVKISELRDQAGETEIDKSDRTPDFTHILNTDIDTNQLNEIKKLICSTLANEIPDKQSKGISFDSSKVLLKDTQSVKGRRRRRCKSVTKTISRNGSPEKHFKTAVLDSNQSEKVQYKNDVMDSKFSESLPTKIVTESVKSHQDTPSQPNDTNNEGENLSKKHLNTTTIEKDTSPGLLQEFEIQVSSMDKMNFSVDDNQIVKSNGPKRGVKRNPPNQITQKLLSDEKSRQSKKVTVYSRKRRHKPVKKSNSQKRPRRKELKPNCSTYSMDELTTKDYVVPKVVRYNNTYPMTQMSEFVQCGFPTNERSFLPAVYPAHFTQQIISEPAIKLAPSTCLTPENSQNLTQTTAAIVDTPSTPLSVGSLQEFFEIDEIFDIFNIEKTIYNLTELHVRALALSLNLNVEKLFALMDRIVEMDVNILREKCEMRDPVQTAWLIKSNSVE